MILAAGVLLLQLSAVSQGSIARVSSSAPSQAAVNDPVTEPVVVANGFPLAVPADLFRIAPPAPEEPAYAAPLEPGRLAPTPVAPVSGPAAESSSLSPSLAPAAFIASAPSDERVQREEQRRKRIWLGLSIAGHSAATFDAWTTRRVVSSNQGYEMDPLMRPFAGNASLYAAIQAGPLLFEYVGHRMMNSHHAWERRTWWVPQTLGMAMNLVSGVHNLGVR